MVVQSHSMRFRINCKYLSWLFSCVLSYFFLATTSRFRVHLFSIYALETRGEDWHFPLRVSGKFDRWTSSTFNIPGILFNLTCLRISNRDWIQLLFIYSFTRFNWTSLLWRDFYYWKISNFYFFYLLKIYGGICFTYNRKSTTLSAVSRNWSEIRVTWIDVEAFYCSISQQSDY